MTDTIKNTISKFAEGFVFTAEDFPIPPDKQNTVTKVLSNMVTVGQIRRLCKGRFYKPQKSKFGELPPDTYQTVKDLLEKNGKIIGYLTGYSIFNKFGLTTQVPVMLQIAIGKEKKPVTRGNYRISFIIQQITIT
jgi:predicted transcriptional regulator of viral defense system